MTDTDSPRTRTNWNDELLLACQAYEAKSGKAVRATHVLYPAEPGIVVRVGDATPFTFPAAKAATLKLRAWVEAP